MFSIRREQGRLGEIAPLVRLIASGEMEADSLWRPALAVLLAEIGDVEAARRELEELVDAGLETIPRGGLGVGGLTYLADACALIEDDALAAPIYEQLLVFEGQNMVIGSAVMCYGAADRMLGALATVMQRWDDAERHLENALVLNRRLGSPTWIAHTLYERARLALRRGPPQDRARHASGCPRRWTRHGGSGCPGSWRAPSNWPRPCRSPTTVDDLPPREVECCTRRPQSAPHRGAAVHSDRIAIPGDAGPNAHRLGHAPLRDRTQLRRADGERCGGRARSWRRSTPMRECVGCSRS